MAEVQDVHAQISHLTEVASQSLKYDTEALYQQLQVTIHDLEGFAREAFQAKLSDLYWSILAKLEEGQALTTAEHEVLEMLMIGEARYYLRFENDVENWKNELRRLIEEIRKQQAAGLDEIDSLMRLRALCREAMRVLPDLAYYFREKERVRKFEQATEGAIDIETRRALANLIKEMMDSDQL